MSPQFGRRKLLDPRGAQEIYDHAQRRARIVGRIIVGFFALVVFLGSGAVVLAHNILGKVHHRPSLSATILGPRPTQQQAGGGGGGGNGAASNGRARNILILGTDSRTGENSSFQPTTGPKQTEDLSDTTILAHLSADGKHVTLVSIPRDSVVQIPQCEKVDADGKTIYGSDGKPELTKKVTALFNQAIEIGGPACTAHTLETLTGVFIDNYIEIDFEGVIKMSSALGGVPLTMCSAVHDTYTGLDLPAGPVNLKGLQALQFVRARHGFPGGDDLHRIQRQQAFMAAMVRKALGSSTLWNLPSLYNFYGDVASSLTTDLTNTQLINLAMSYRHLDTDNVVFATVPTFDAPADSPWAQHLFWDPKASKDLFDAIAADRPLATTTQGGQNVAQITVAPADISVRVLNGTTTTGLAHDVAADLEAKGFKIDGIDSAANVPVAKTTIAYAPSLTNSAATLTAAFAAPPGRKVEQSSTSSTITLTIGDDWQGLATASASPSAPASGSAPAATPSVIPGVKTTTATTDHCIEGG